MDHINSCTWISLSLFSRDKIRLIVSSTKYFHSLQIVVSERRFNVKLKLNPRVDRKSDKIVIHKVVGNIVFQL